MTRTVRPMRLPETRLVIDYFLNADLKFLARLGVDPAKLPEADAWFEAIAREYGKPLPERAFYFVAWESDGVPIGHSNLSDIEYGERAFMHLHIWNPALRLSGNGTYFVRESVRLYFEKFELQQLYCQPNALNIAPNRTLPKVGFKYLKTYETTPGWLNYHQPVTLWVLEREDSGRSTFKES